MKKIYTDSLIKKDYKGKICIDWNENIGNKIPFVYDNVSGEIEIMGYNKDLRKVNLRYGNNMHSISPAHLLELKIGRLIGVVGTNSFKYNISQIIRTNFGYIEILERYNEGTVKRYVCFLIKDNIEKVYPETIICENITKSVGVSSVYKTHNHLVKYFLDEEKAKKYSFGSNKKETMKCPMCGHEKEMVISRLCLKGFSCPVCSDGISYPNKFIANILCQKNIIFKPEKIFDFSGNKRYDFFINKTNMIIECHGLQHYEECYSTGNRKSKYEEMKNDKYKEKIAKENGISHYIVLDCRYSELDWIKKSVMNSELPSLLNFKEEDIDWLKCHKESLKSLIYKICNMWNEGYGSTQDIADHVGLSRVTITRYLKEGVRLGVCDYTKEKSRNIGACKIVRKGKTNNSAKKKVKCIELNIIFESCKEASEFLEEKYGEKFNSQYIAECGRGIKNNYKKMHFKYV